MMKFSIDISIRRLVILVSLLLTLSCGIFREQSEPPSFPDDMPLSDFIIGRWKYEGKYYYEGYGYSDIFWEYTFVDKNVIKIWTGNDGGTCSYKFIEPEVISIDCSPRRIDIMKWSVKRDRQFLLIQRLDNGELKGGEQLKFQRVPSR